MSHGVTPGVDVPPRAAVRNVYHLLICLQGDVDDPDLVRSGLSLAQRLPARVTVVFAFSPGSACVSRRLLDHCRTVAAAGGAVLVELPAYSPVSGIVEFARARGVTHVVVGDRPRGTWPRRYRASLAQQLEARLDRVDLYVRTHAEDSSQCNATS